MKTKPVYVQSFLNMTGNGAKHVLYLCALYKSFIHSESVTSTPADNHV